MPTVNVSQVRQLSPFRYPGGKTWLVPTVREWLTSIGRPPVFLEPFAGGGAVGLTVAAENLAERVVMVELDPDVAAVWQVVINGSDRDVAALSSRIINFEVTHANVRTALDATAGSITDRAFRTIVKNRCQRGGIMAAGAGLVKNGENGRGLSSRWYPHTLVRRFEAIRTFRERIDFRHGDAFEAIRSHPGAVVFADPPYTAGGKRAGARLYTHSQLDHDRLFRDITEHAGPTLLTYDDAWEVRMLAVEHGFRFGTIPMKSAHHVVMRELAIWKD